ncbi:hypothetical protein [Rhodococcus sp. UNC363MFTsu5.1]|uniref:hypothetical protein n=1 Tax=Rhodococcus sp. UNC363MFTsu5.1 TaxID=1449069 RepID=UPI0004854597|nr:hypothetical protein [Rhodococcus sp. UNC363MFTsu5.1]
MIKNDNVRKGLYVAAVAIGAALMVFGFIDQDTADQMVRIAAGALLGGIGELARRNVRPRPAGVSADGLAQVVTDAVERAVADRNGMGIPAILTNSAVPDGVSVEAIRRSIERQLGQSKG